MTNLEWLKTRGLIITNDVYRATIGNAGKIGVNVFIKLRDSDYSDYKEKGIEWLLEEHKEPIKLKQWEKDLIEAYQEQLGVDHAFYSNYILEELKERGHFKGVMDTSMNTQIILENCEVEDR